LATLLLESSCSGPTPEPEPQANDNSKANTTAGSGTLTGPELESGPTRHDGPTTVTFDGVVRLVDRSEGVVSVDHEDIPGLMPAMLMDFRPQDPALLDDLVVGDEVVGTLRLDRDDRGQVNRMDLVDLAVSRPALAGPATQPDLDTLPPAVPELEPGQPVPDFEMTTQDGNSLRLIDLRGKVVVLTFIFTRCPQPEFCPMMDRKFAALADRVARSPERADRVRLLSVSFDPEHDSPEVLAAHAGRVGASPPLWTFAVASHDELAKVAQPLGLSYIPMTNQIQHSLSTAVIAPDGTLSRLEKGNRWEPGDLDAELRPLLDHSDH
jgi:protein SCO1/2